MQEFIGLLGMDAKCLDSRRLFMMNGTEDGCTPSSCPCCSSSTVSSPSGAVSPQQRQKEESMAAAVEAVLREVGEDPSREVIH